MPDAIDLDPQERRVAVAGDWHRNGAWVEQVISVLARQSSGVRTILHLGDFGLSPSPQGQNFLNTVDYCCRSAGIERILVTPGNHEHWDWLDAEFGAASGESIQVSERVSVLPRGYRFNVGGRSFMSFGGAVSVDQNYRVEGDSWFSTEGPTDADVNRAIAAGTVDVLLTHETIDGGTPAVARLIRGPSSWPLEALYLSMESRRRVTRVWDATRARILLHGHMHVSDEIELADGRRIYSLGRDYQAGNLGILDLDDLSWSWLATPVVERPGRVVDWDKQYLDRPNDQ